MKILLLAVLLSGAVTARAADLAIAAASDLSFCLEELNAGFRETHPGAELQVATGSSGNFFAQIKNGAPFDVFLSADMQYPRALIAAGLAEADSLTPYAIGRLVLWSSNKQIDVTRGLEILRDPVVVRKLAIANPAHAPYGRAAKAALEHAGLWSVVQSRLVFGENISQTLQFVQTGNAEAGIVALSLVRAPRLEKAGRFFEIPAEFHPPLEQGAVLTKRGAPKKLAQDYLTFLRSEAARKIFDRYGFRLGR